jgi:hypothetical protein
MTAKTLFLFAALALAFVASSGKPAYAELALSNLRVQGIVVVDNIYVSFADPGRNYTILVDFQGEGAPDRVLLRTRWDDGVVDRVDEAPFDVLPTGPTTGTLVNRARALDTARPRSTDWWAEDDRGGTSNTLVQRLVIRWATAERARLLVDPSGARTALRDHCMPGESVGEAIRMERE